MSTETSLKALPHQIEKSDEMFLILKERGLVYLAGEVRSGKTLTAILTAEMTDAKRILVLTKKAAISGWEKFSSFMSKDYIITNYEQINNIKGTFDLLIVDEAHNLGQVGKPSLRVKSIRKLAYNKPLILLSGTPYAETKASLYHQMCVSKYSPFDTYKSFYKFFAIYGIPGIQYIAGRKLVIYKETVEELDKVIKPYFVTMTQEEAGIETKSGDVVHYVELSQQTKDLYNQLFTDKVAIINGEEVACDSDMKLRMTLHQLETGIEKFDFIRDNFSGKIAVMSHFIDERRRLSEYLPHIDVYSSNKHAEGVDLSHYDHFIILSGDYSGSKFIQRRERNVNINNNKTAMVHHILVKDAISEQVYNAVSHKRDFNNQVFQRVRL